VCIPRHAAEVHLATQAETLQVWHERLDHQNKCHVMKVLKQHGINVQANKEFYDGCALGKAHWQSFGTRTSRPSIVGEQINAYPVMQNKYCRLQYESPAKYMVFLVLLDRQATA